MNHVDVVDFDAESELVRGTCWATVFSPASTAYDLSLDTKNAVAKTSVPPRAILSWMGLPGTGFGGMNSSVAGVPLFTMPYDFSGKLDRLERVPIAIWSTKDFVGRWWETAAAPITAELADDGRLTGTLTSGLDVPLADCVLIYENWAYPLRTIQPGQRIDVAADVDPQTVETFLRRTRLRGDRDVAPPYDRASFEMRGSWKS